MGVELPAELPVELPAEPYVPPSEHKETEGGIYCGNGLRATMKATPKELSRNEYVTSWSRYSFNSKA